MRILLNYRSNPLLLLFITSYAIVNAQQIARVQYSHIYTYPGNSVTFPSGNSAGNAIVVVASWYLTPGTPTISDTQGNTYMLLPPLTGGGAGNGEQTSILIWYALNIAAGANTVTISGAGIDVGMTAVEYSGIAGIGTTSTLPYFGGTPTTTPTSSSFTPSGAGSLLFVVFADETNTQTSIAAGSGYALIQGDGNHVDIEEDNVNSSAGPQTASITVGTATWSWAMYVVEFLPVGGTPPIGTVLWSNPGDGSGFPSIVPAVPASTGVADIFGLQNDGTVAAITSDGATAWSADASQARMVVPDFLGGLVLVQQSSGNSSIVKLDGITGQPYPSYLPNPATDSLLDVAVHTDGTIFAVQHDDQQTSVVGINPTAGTQKFGGIQLLGSSQGAPYFNILTSLMIAGDGYAYVAYSYMDNANPPVMHLMLLRVDSSGNATNLDIADLPAFQNGALLHFQANLITNADTGTLISWGDAYIPIPDLRSRTAPRPDRRNPHFGRADLMLPGPLGFGPTYGMAITAGTGVVIITAPAVSGQITNIDPILQREDGSIVGAVGVGNLDSPQYNMAAFSPTGNLLWTVANDQPQIATSDGGVEGQFGTIYDQNGNATGQIPLYTQSWTYNSYQIQGTAINQVFAIPTLLATSWAFQLQKTAARPLPDSVKANTDQVSGLGTLFPQRNIDYYAFQGNNSWLADTRNPTATITEYLFKVSGAWPPSGCTAPGYNPNANETFCSFGDRHFDDLITYGFVRRQQLFVNLPGGRRYRVQIYPCTAQNKFGNPVWENLLSAPTSASILVNGDAGSTAQRTCTQ